MNSYPPEVQTMIDRAHAEDEAFRLNASGHERLWAWFGLSRASFLVLPRVLMHEMSDEWQRKMTDLLEEYEETFSNQPTLGTRVLATEPGNKRLIRWPDWLLNYRHPDRREVDLCKGIPQAPLS